MIIYVGIDVSKLTFDVAVPTEKGFENQKYSNDSEGFTSLQELLSARPEAVHCVMEASGPYFLPLAKSLHGASIALSVVNPLIIKNFGKTLMMRAKTDKQDARLLSKYGKTHEPEAWTPNAVLIDQLGQLQSLLDIYVRQRTALKNRRGSQISTGIPNPFFLNSIDRQLESVEGEIDGLERQIEALARENYPKQYNSLRSVPGIGPKTATALIVITKGFTRFDKAKQLVCFLGLSPRIFESGTSVKGKNKICKLGAATARRLLYMCSWQAKKKNPACKAMFDRLVENGKPKMKALIAVANKLLHIAFALIEKDQMFDKGFYEKNLQKLPA